MELILCTRCGSDKLEKRADNTYQCKSCGALFSAYTLQKQNAILEALDEQERKHLSEARKNLYSAVKEEYLSTENMVKWCNKIKGYDSKDFFANFYYATTESPEKLNRFLHDQEIPEDYLETVMEFLLRIAECRNVGRIKAIIEKRFKSDKKLDYMTRLENLAKKLDEGYYNTDIPRDVFVAHSSKDIDIVNDVIDELEGAGLTCFAAFRNLRHGKGAKESYVDEINNAIKHSECFVFVSSENSRTFACDAMQFELPYVEKLEKGIKRIEYHVDDKEINPGVDQYLKNFFKGLEWCRTTEDLIFRVKSPIVSNAKSRSNTNNETKVQEKSKVSVALNVTSEIEDAEARNNLGDCYYNGDGIEQDYKKAVECYTKAAKQGYAPAQKNLGNCYYNGDGVVQDYEKAVEWYTKAAEQGNAEAQYSLGLCYYKDDGVDQDYEEAVEWYTKAAEQGNVKAQYNLGVCYEYGKGIKQDYKKAVEWYTKAARQRYVPAQKNLGNCYYNGITTGTGAREKNYVKAVEWYTRAARKGDAEAQKYLGDCYTYGRGVEQNYIKAVEWYTKAAEQGYAAAQNNLGKCYYNDDGVEQDYEKAVEWYTKAAEQGYVKAQYNLGFCYYCGIGIGKDYKQAAEWYAKAARQGHSAAQNNLGHCYHYGNGVVQDYKKAIKWYTKSAEQGYADAQNNLGDCYYHGNGVVQDYKKAVEWYTKAAEQGLATAQNNLGDCYYSGNGENKDYKKAAAWYAKAAVKGDATAQNNLGDCYYSGNGENKDYKKAAEWYTKAAKQGYAAAQNNLGKCYHYGNGVERDYEIAKEWYEKAHRRYAPPLSVLSFIAAILMLGSIALIITGAVKDNKAIWFVGFGALVSVPICLVIEWKINDVRTLGHSDTDWYIGRSFIVGIISGSLGIAVIITGAVIGLSYVWICGIIFVVIGIVEIIPFLLDTFF